MPRTPAEFSTNVQTSVRTELPVTVTHDDVEQCPAFALLLQDLSQNYLNEDGTTKLLQRRLKEKQDDLNREKTRFLQYETLYEELDEVLLDHALQEDAETPSDAQLYSQIRDKLTIASSLDYLTCNRPKSEKTTLLGLNSEVQHSGQHLDSAVIQQTMIPEIEQSLSQKCTSLLSSYSPSNDDDNSLLTTAKFVQLPEIMKADKQQLIDDKKNLENMKVVKEENLLHYYQVLFDTIEILETLFTQHCLKSQREGNKVTIEYLKKRNETLILKLKVAEKQLSCNTYTPGAVKALNTIRNELHSKLEQTNKQGLNVRQALESYTMIGSEFDDLVREYTYLQEEIQKKEEMSRSLISSTQQADGE